MNNMPGGMKKHHESNEPESHQMTKTFHYFKIMTLSWWFSHKTAEFYTRQCISPSLFSSLKSHKVVWTSHWRTMASLEMQFSLVHMHKSLNNETIIIQGCWVSKTCAHEDRESLHHPLLTDRCLNRAWSIILQPILLSKPMRTDLWQMPNFSSSWHKQDQKNLKCSSITHSV